MKRKILKIAFVVAMGFSINSFSQNSALIDQQNSNSKFDNSLSIGVYGKTSTVSNTLNRGILLGDYNTNGASKDASFNIYFDRWRNNASFNIFGGSDLINSPKYFSVERWGSVSIFGDILKFGNNPAFRKEGFEPIALQSKSFTNDVTSRWLVVNPRYWSQTSGDFNYFREGTYLNSRVLISQKFGFDSPETMPSDALLAVDGKLYCEGLKIALSGTWADYVFSNDYSLRNLEEVENYISTEKHLPGIPSAAEIQEKGLDVAYMQKLQMEKIEELTLYLIALKKENESLKTRVNNLEAAKQ